MRRLRPVSLLRYQLLLKWVMLSRLILLPVNTASARNKHKCYNGSTMIRKKQKPLSKFQRLRARLTNKRIIVGALVGIVAIVVSLQLAYPYDRGLWFSNLG